MKKLVLSITLCLLTICVFAQKDSLSNSIQMRATAIGHNGNNEIKLNLLYMALGIPELSYERLIADNMGIGVSTMVSFANDQSLNFGVLANYRLYFGNNKANGFFIEGSSGLISKRDTFYYYGVNSPSQYTEINKGYFALGAACGAKFLTRNGFLGEAYLGVDRLLGNNNEDFYPRIGITIGKRF